MSYKSPIDIIYGQLQRDFDGKVFSAVQNVDINVDREELIKALQCDRGQYEKGYADGCKETADKFATMLKDVLVKAYDHYAEMDRKNHEKGFEIMALLWRGEATATQKSIELVDEIYMEIKEGKND